MLDIKTSFDYEILPLTSGADDFFYVNIKFMNRRSSLEQIEEIAKIMGKVFEEFVKFLEKENAISNPMFSCSYNYKEFTMKFCTRSKDILKEFEDKKVNS